MRDKEKLRLFICACSATRRDGKIIFYASPFMGRNENEVIGEAYTWVKRQEPASAVDVLAHREFTREEVANWLERMG